MAARWAADQLDALRDADPAVPESVFNRAADNWRPLLAIADAAGGEWPERARNAAVALAAEYTDESRRVQLLADIADAFEAKKTDRLSSDDPDRAPGRAGGSSLGGMEQGPPAVEEPARAAREAVRRIAGQHPARRREHGQRILPRHI